jgi:hypothetical protein
MTTYLPKITSALKSRFAEASPDLQIGIAETARRIGWRSVAVYAAWAHHCMSNQGFSRFEDFANHLVQEAELAAEGR